MFVDILIGVEVMQYIWRAGVKNKDKEIEDLEKAIFLLKEEIERIKFKK